MATLAAAKLTSAVHSVPIDTKPEYRVAEATAPGLAVAGAKRRFGAVVALSSVDLAVARGELLTLLGPSGSGKTTLLKVIAGFEIPDEGTVCLGGRDVTFTAPAKRDIGMVFQNYALFPHMTIAENVAFPLEMRRATKDDIRSRVEKALRMVDLAALGGRLPKQLSGGQQQRAALARAVVFGPSLLLLDEPFGALDRKLREQMQLEVRRLQRQLGLTAVFVTHDQEEALIMSDRIAVMEQGRISQVGTPPEVYHRPANRFVAGFVGESNLYRAQLDGKGGAILDAGARLLVGGDRSGEKGVLLRLERPRLLRPGEAADNVFHGRVAEVVYLGEAVKYRLELDAGFELLARWPYRATGGAFAIGERLQIGWEASDSQLVDWT